MAKLYSITKHVFLCVLPWKISFLQVQMQILNFEKKGILNFLLMGHLGQNQWKSAPVKQNFQPVQKN